MEDYFIVRDGNEESKLLHCRCATRCMTTSAPQFKMRSVRLDMKINVKLNMRYRRYTIVF